MLFCYSRRADQVKWRSQGELPGGDKVWGHPRAWKQARFWLTSPVAKQWAPAKAYPPPGLQSIRCNSLGCNSSAEEHRGSCGVDRSLHPPQSIARPLKTGFGGWDFMPPGAPDPSFSLLPLLKVTPRPKLTRSQHARASPEPRLPPIRCLQAQTGLGFE